MLHISQVMSPHIKDTHQLHLQVLMIRECDGHVDMDQLRLSNSEFTTPGMLVCMR